MEPDSEQKAEASFLLRAGNLAAGTFNANVGRRPRLSARMALRKRAFAVLVDAPAAF